MAQLVGPPPQLRPRRPNLPKVPPRRTHYKGVKSDRSSFAIPTVDPNAAGASRPPAIYGILKRTRDEEYVKR